MTLQDVLTIVWRRRWIVLLLTLIGGAAAWLAGGTTQSSVATYSAEATLTVAADEDPRSVELYSFIATETSEITSKVDAGLGEEAPGSVEISPISAIGALRIVAFAQPSEDTARTIVELYAEEISDYGSNQRIVDRDERLARLAVLEQDLQETIKRLDRELTIAENALPESQQGGRNRGDQLKQTELDAASDALATILREKAELNSRTDEDLRPFEPLGHIAVEPEAVAADPLGRTGRLAVGITLGLVLGLILAFGLHRFDARLFTRRDAEAAYSLPVIAEIPKIPWRKRRGNRIITHELPTDKASEAYRVLRSGIARARAVQLAEPNKSASESGTVILITSASAAVGKTTTVANLAVAATDAGSSVLVASADLRQPAIHEYFDVDPAAVGLTDAATVMRQGQEATLDSYVVRTNVVGVSFLPHGSTVVNPGEVLADARPLLEEARAQFDLVILDSPPMLAGNDVDELVSTVDLVVQVARAGRTTIDEGLWTDETIQRRQTPTCGLVLIGARSDLERRSSSRRAGLRSKLGSLFSRAIGQTGKIAWGSKAMPRVSARPPIEAAGSHPATGESPAAVWPVEHSDDIADDPQSEFTVTQQIVLPLPPPNPYPRPGNGSSGEAANGEATNPTNGTDGTSTNGTGRTTTNGSAPQIANGSGESSRATATQELEADQPDPDAAPDLNESPRIRPKPGKW